MDLNKRHYQRRYFILIAGTILLLILSYKLGFKRSLELRAECKNLSSRLVNIKDAPMRIKQLEEKKRSIENLIGKATYEKDTRDVIVNYVSTYCEKEDVTLRQLHDIHISEEEDYRIETNRLTLEGDFHKLLQLLYHIENDYTFGQVSSVRFYKAKNIKSRQNELLLEIFVQTINPL